VRTSLIVRQFFALLAGAIPVQEVKPVMVARVLECVSEFAICQQCSAHGDQDVIRFENGVQWEVCRCCRAVHENGKLTDFVLSDGYVERMVV